MFFVKVIVLLLMTLMPFAKGFAEELKTLILVIATDDKPAYRELQKIWEAYLDRDPAHYEVYFLRADPLLEAPAQIKKNEIIVKTEESLVPGILNKSLLGLEALQSRLNEFHYVLRTNLSSFFVFDNLTKYLSKLPREQCYCGISLYQTKELGLPPDLGVVPFISGAGIILSVDVVQKLLSTHTKYEKYKTLLPDDVFIGLVFQKESVPFISAQRWDYPTYAGWLEHNHKIEDYAYHFRAKRSYSLRTAEDPYEDEILTLKALLKRYYSTSSLSQ